MLTAFLFGLLFYMSLQYAVLSLGVQFDFRSYSKRLDEKDLPSVGVFVSARNEGHNLPACLEALEKVDYPEGKILFFIGDDGSSDNTWEIINLWASLAGNRHAVKLQVPPPPGKNGKAMALAKMVEKSEAELLLFTDADCIVPSTWIKEMVGSFAPGCGMIVGVTRISASTWFGRMQELEWWLGFGVIKALADVRVPLTAMGNNMLISREAYDRVGGFEAVADSLTEDFAILQRLSKLGHKPIHQVSRHNLVLTKGVEDFRGLLDQRKRWVSGAMSLPWYWCFIIGCQAAFYPLVLICLFLNPLWAILGWVGKTVCQSVFLLSFTAKTETKIPKLDLLIFECYYLCTSFITLLYYVWPSAIKWKGRSYPQ